MNVVILKGNITRDIQLSYTPNQTEVAEFGMAVNEKRGDKEKVHFFDLVCFGKRAPILNQYVHKGDPLLVRGKLDYQQWEKDGKKQSKIKIIVDDFEFLGKSNKSAEPAKQDPPGDAEQSVPYGVDDDSEIPF